MSLQSADPQYLTVHQLSAALRSCRLSSAELVNTLLDRIATHDQKLHAFVALYPEEARLAAEAADKAIRAGHAVGPLTWHSDCPKGSGRNRRSRDNRRFKSLARSPLDHDRDIGAKSKSGWDDRHRQDAFRRVCDGRLGHQSIHGNTVESVGP